MNSTYSIQAHPPRLNDTFFPELSQFFGINQISSDRSETNSIDPQLSQMMEEDTLSPKATRSSTLLANMKKILEKKWYYAPGETDIEDNQKTIYTLFDKKSSRELVSLRNFLRRQALETSPCSGPFHRPSLISKPPILFVPKFVILSIVARCSENLDFASLELESPSGKLEKIKSLYNRALKLQNKKKDKEVNKINIIKFRISKKIIKQNN
ncbi:MAG: hypothetical protein BGO14_09130 [Chlamydiales bacterium 38-26]|nr:hypothetical protein [Chlamydiales bacterium]OJV11140.1 MAG: hypothetical protein BGO14_09130 [Chlamydiales bacterium 38-26]